MTSSVFVRLCCTLAVINTITLSKALYELGAQTESFHRDTIVNSSSLCFWTLLFFFHISFKQAFCGFTLFSDFALEGIKDGFTAVESNCQTVSCSYSYIAGL